MASTLPSLMLHSPGPNISYQSRRSLRPHPGPDTGSNTGPSTGRVAGRMIAVTTVAVSATMAGLWRRGSVTTTQLAVIAAASVLVSIIWAATAVHALATSRSKLLFESTHEALTGLPNRRQFSKLLSDTLGNGRGGAVIVIDLDGFRSVNETLGHSVGDDVLVEVSHIICDTARFADTVSHLGSDEFAVLVDAEDETEVLMIAQRLVDSLRVTRYAGIERIRVTASVGVVRWPRHTPSTKIDDLVQATDAAIEDAKRHNGDQMVLASL